MDKKLVEDYLNKNSHTIDEKVVVKGCIDKGHFITVLAEWESKEGLKSDYLDISIFDLMVFIYSKMQ